MTEVVSYQWAGNQKGGLARMAHREKNTKHDTLGEEDDGLETRGLAIRRVTNGTASANDVTVDSLRGRKSSSARQWVALSVRCWILALTFSFGIILAAHASSTALQIKSLTAYASQVKHQWTKYAEDNNGTLRQTSYVDLANIIRADNTATVLNLQDWNPLCLS